MLYPVLGAAADGVGGLAAARAVSLLCMLLVTALLYSMTRRLFNERVGLCAAIIFSSPSRPCSSAIWPPMTRPALCLLALAAWIVVRDRRVPLAGLPPGGTADDARGGHQVRLGPVPADHHRAQRAGRLAVPGRKALIPPVALGATVAALLGGALYLAGPVYLKGVEFTTTNRFMGNIAASVLLRDSLQWGGLTFALALIGAVAFLLRPRTEPGEQIAEPGGRLRRLALGLVLTGTALLVPADQIHLHTLTSLQKHIGFGLFFAAPCAGVGLARIVGDHFRRAQVGIAIWGALLVLGMTQADELFNAWPNSTAFTHVMSRYLRPGAHYLVEVDEVPIYYFRRDADAEPHQFTSTYYIGYTDQQGQFLTGDAGYVAAIKGGYFRVVAYNFQTTPGADNVLARTLEADPDYRLAARLPNGNDTVAYYVWIKR